MDASGATRMDIENVDILTFSLLIWTSFVGHFVHPAGEGIGGIVSLSYGLFLMEEYRYPPPK